MKHLIIKSFILITVSTWAFPQVSTEQSLRRYLVSPDFIRRHQHELQLTEDQRQFIVQEINRTQSEFTEAKWKLQDEMVKLTDLVKSDEMEESVILEQLDVVLNLEKEIKRQQLRMAVRIKNTLSKEQLSRLQNLQAREARRARVTAPRPNPAPRQR